MTRVFSVYFCVKMCYNVFKIIKGGALCAILDTVNMRPFLDCMLANVGRREEQVAPGMKFRKVRSVTLRSKPEATIEKYFINRVKTLGGITVKLTGSKGIPDRLVLLANVLPFMVELKRPEGGIVSEAQKSWHEWLRVRGHAVLVISTKEEVDYALQAICFQSVGPKELSDEQRRSLRRNMQDS